MSESSNPVSQFESKTELWERNFKTNPKFVKPITGKQYRGNSVSPFYIVSRLTSEFGPCGLGWGLRVIDERMERLSEHDVLHIARVCLWYLAPDGQRGEIEQIGQTKATYMKSDGKLLVDEDAPKKSVTDALTKCASYLGFAGDIFSGRWDDNKYVNELAAEFAEPEKPPKQAFRQKQNGVVSDVLSQSDGLPEDDIHYLDDLTLELIDLFETKDGIGAVVEKVTAANLEFMQKLYLWNQLPSDLRTAFKAFEREHEKAKAKAVPA